MNSASAVANQYSASKLGRYAGSYQRKDVEIVKQYWQKEVLDFVPLWEKAIELGENRV